MILKAKHVIPVDAPSIVNGAIECSEGRIVRVGLAKEFGRAYVEDFGDAAILPGLVNAHTHLELTRYHKKVPPGPNFADWLRRLVEVRNQNRSRMNAMKGSEIQRENRSFSNQTADSYEDELRNAVREGIARSLACGVTTLGDISANPAIVRPLLATSPLNAVSFGEVIAVGKGRSLLDERLLQASNTNFANERVRIGLSPHSPYTVEPPGLRKCADVARKLDLPVCVHIAESLEEDEFTRWASGPLAEFLADLGLWDDGIPVGGSSPVELLAKTGLLGPKTVLAHANYVSDSDIELIARSKSSVAFCPRTHAAFGHTSHRFRDMEQAGINVCLGTDSLASNPSLNLFDEVRFLHREEEPADLQQQLRRATLNGAVALGVGKEVGSLTPGKRADAVVFPLPHGASTWDEIFRCETVPIRVYSSGTQVA